MNELSLAASVSPAPVVSPVEDVVDDLHLVATSPAAMAEAQRNLATWCEQKIAILQGDVARLNEAIDVAVKNGWKLDALDRQHKIAVDRVEYYTKVKAAVDAGYCVVPNFPVDVFAIRTNRKKPLKNETERSWQSHAQPTESPALGLGTYVDSDPAVYQHTGPSGEIDEKTGKAKQITTYFAKHFQEIDFPISVARPEIMSATAQAMALKCFDEIGVLPERRNRRDDPIVVGRIRMAGGRRREAKTISFLIAWYVNTRDL